MKLKREDYIAFLSSEYDTQMKEYGRLIGTKATVLKERGEVFVGKFIRFRGDFAIFKVRISDNLPRKNSFWTASCFIGEMASYKNWGDLSWAVLREQYQSNYSDVHCAWISKSENPDFCLIGVKNTTIDFADLLESQHPIIAFGPNDPPLKYILNLKDIVQNSECDTINEILDYTKGDNVWNPQRVTATEDLNIQILRSLESHNHVAIQGPPGTGKTYRMAKLIAQLLSKGKSVLVTALTNEALKVVASKEDLEPYLRNGRISKTSLTIDERHELPNLMPNEGNVCNAASGHLSLATFYISSGWAKDVQEMIPFDYVIMDEASQALLPMIAASKKLGRKVVWIGDQNQLAPIIKTNEDKINTQGWNPIVKGFDTLCNNIVMPTFMLSDTFRLTKRGADFTGIFYNNELNSVAKIDEVKTSLHELNKQGGPSSLFLELEVGNKKPNNALNAIYDLTERIFTECSDATIAILSKFKETVKELQKTFMTKLQSEEIPDNLKIETVDRIQGLTVDYTIFLIPNASVSYSLESELFNVATSRASRCTIIVADRMILKSIMSDEVRRFFLKIDENKVATFKPSTTQTITAGDLKVTVLGKISLPEKPLKEIVEYKENIFIIDTNVFVKCPTIISKVGKYKVVIPTTVLEELDRLKLKQSIDKKALSDAVKNINKAFLNNYSSMEEGDSSLLPKGFDAQKADCLILSVALKYKAEDKNPILLTSDNLLQSKALGLGIKTISLQDFLSERR
ncbi:PIN domain-containing protein [uncultured Prevotella sp.]|uniref:PIN domain-containing protein n=1 Tax=uncultured Prevotella sp. TaxID=159272 RepID=UPI00259B236E|nr:PIN domain-containing protein [uncultured Prevotella sp.]